MRAFVTGANGFIGSTLVEELSTLGFDVRVLVRPGADLSNLKTAIEGGQIEQVEGDLSDLARLRKAVAGSDYVFHLAGVSAAPTRRQYFEVNQKSTKRLAQAVARECPELTRFVFVSSLAAGGPAKALRPRQEGERDRPVSVYGESKLQGERSLLRYKQRFPISVVRPPIVYGPRDRSLSQLVRAISRNLIPLFRGDNGHKYYSLIHVRDLVRGIVQAAVQGRTVPSGEVFYLAGDGMVTYEDVVSAIAERLHRDPLRIPLPGFALRAAAAGLTAFGWATSRAVPLNLDRLNELIPDYWICSNDKAKQMLGFRPEFDFSAGLADAIEWYRKTKWI